MEIILVIFVIIILFLVCYLFFVKMELRRIKKELDLVLSRKTNGLVHTEFTSKEIHDLIECINTHLTEIKSKESKLERKNANFVKMIRNISHDLRTPLTSSLGYVSLMLESDVTEQEKIKNLKIVEERLKRLSELIDSFFEFSKIFSNDQIIELDEINLVAVIEKAISNHYEDFSKDNRMIDFKTNKRKIKIKSNEVMLIRVFDNLIRNAYKHSNGNLDIEINQTDEKVKIKFINDLLYKDLDVDRVFDEFYTVDISRTKGNTGLGLAIAKEFVEQLKGKIKADKKNNKLIITIIF
ncbi:MAG TPA: HAMP domain-containing histidine kinase [Candidatus Onthousia excrementipullorum]|uniref:histidine kinase n=1 Tax=Candidatus Onthousia excrementipullorum TaxID=2840884 RepID=A0A9D1DW55_9FIRM|nr:HAMP domain-containing histidine kinase [Candidatus Onthousia excrementipullorum]